MTAQDISAKSHRLQRAYGQARIVSKQTSNDATCLDQLRQKGSLKTVFPRALNGRLDAVLVNTAGGVTGGDRFEIDVHASDANKVCITTQAAERIYRAPKGNAGRIKTKLSVGAGAELLWLPQETILFDGCNLKRSLDVDIADTGRFLMVEPLVFGRAASGETLGHCSVTDQVSITSAGQPVYLDQIRMSGDVAVQLARPAVARGAGAVATVVLVDPNAAALIEGTRERLSKTAGASLLTQTTLVVRILAEDGFALRTQLFSVLNHLTHNAMPKNWRL